MVFQPRRRAATGVATGTGELLPHLLTLTPPDESERGGYFLPRCLCPHEHLPPGSLVLFAARTFLPSTNVAVAQGAIERPAGLLRNYKKVWNY